MNTAFFDTLAALLITLTSAHLQFSPAVANDNTTESNKRPATIAVGETSTRIRWRAKVGNRTGPMTISGDRIVVGTNLSGLGESVSIEERSGGAVLCIDSHDGQLVWQARHTRLDLAGSDRMFQGVRSKAAIDGDRVYYVSNRGELVCVDLNGFRDGENDGPYSSEARTEIADADIVWKLDMVTQLNVAKMDGEGDGNPTSSPVVYGDAVFAVTGNGCAFLIGNQQGDGFVPRPDASSFIAADKRTGKVLWSKAVPSEDLVYSWSSPVKAEYNGLVRIVFPGGDGRLYAIDPGTLEIGWIVDCNSPSATRWNRAARGSRNFFVATPTVVENLLYVGLNHDTEADPLDAPLYAIDMAVAERDVASAIKWTFRSKGWVGTRSSVVVDRQHVYAVSEMSQTLLAIDCGNGQEAWRYTGLDSPVGCFGSPAIHNDLLYVPSLSHIDVFQLSNARQPIRRYAFGTQLNGTPQFVGDVMYVTTDASLLAIDL